MAYFYHDDIRFEYLERSTGVPVIFQHGMGGNAERVTQPLSNPEFQLLSFDFRGHGKTSGLGSVHKLNFTSFADDVIAFMDFLGLEQTFMGGNSMGAGVSLNLVLRYPERVKGLILLKTCMVRLSTSRKPKGLYHHHRFNSSARKPRRQSSI